MRSALCAGSCTSGHFRPYSPECLEKRSEKVLSSVSIAHLAGTQWQNYLLFIPFLES